MATAKKPKTKKQNTKKKPGSKPVSKPKTQKKKVSIKGKIWGVILAVGLVVVVVAIVAVVTITDSGRHEKLVAEYEEVWNTYAKAQNDLGFEFGAILRDLGFSMDDGAKYVLDEKTQDELGRKCTKKLGVYEEIYSKIHTVKNEKIAERSTAEIDDAIKSLKDYTDKITSVMGSVEDCREIGEAKIEEIDNEIAKKEAEEKAKAEEEAARKRRQEEYARNVLNYDKFNNQIREGMSLAAVKNVYGGFDSQCKVSSQSGGWVIYSCSPASYSSNYWVASFTFYNGVLKSKAQTGLD